MRILSLLLSLLLCSLSGYGQVRQISSAPQGFVTGKGAFSAFMSALDAGQTTALQVLGDSTGNASDEWVYLVGQWLGAQYPSHSVRWRLWDDSTQAYSAPSNITTGAGGERYLNLDGTGGATIAAADIAWPATDLDLRVKVAPASWRPTSAQAIMTKTGGAGARGLRWEIQVTSGKLTYIYSADGGTNTVAAVSTVAVTDTGTTPQWLRVVHDVDNGAAGSDVKFYTSTDGATWTQLGATVTAAGVVTLNNPAVPWEIGSRSTLSELFTGKIYRVEILSGIDGYALNPLQIDAWEPLVAGATFAGAPEIWLINASHPGAVISYLDDSTRRPKIMPNYGQTAALISVSHNHGKSMGATYIASFAAFVANVKARLPNASITMVTQNPRTAPAVSLREHAVRLGQMAGWARANGVAVVDVYNAFHRSGIADATLISDADGIHPTATGSQLWAVTIEKAMTLSH